MKKRKTAPSFVAYVYILLFPAIGLAQQSSGIAGVVRDTSGAVLPGVTVETTSPALIEKVRTVVTDGQGRYNIVDLRPGTYTITFTLTGFNVFRRQGVVLTAGFTAAVNAEMQVGALEETVTVTGQSPLIDTQNVRQQTVVSTELLETLPTGPMALSSTLITLVPGMSGATDVGGSSGIWRSNGVSGGLLFHGKSDLTVQYDGMSTMSPLGAGVLPYVMNSSMAEETVAETGGGSAQSNATLVMNMVPKEGGNIFSFGASVTYANEHLQSDNLSDELRAQGLTHSNRVLHFYDVNLTAGGPITRDRLWFFAASRMTGNKNTVAGLFFNETQGTPFYTADMSREAYRKEWLRSLGGRVTWQASQKNKVSGFADVQTFFNRGRGEFSSPEAYQHQYNFWPGGLFQVTWTSPRTSRLLLEAGASYMMGRWPYPSPGDGEFRVHPDDISILELSTNFRYNARAFYNDRSDQYRYAQRFSTSYVTGSHALKAGIQLEQGIINEHQMRHGDVNYSFLQGVPTSLTQFATPYLQKNRMMEVSLFAQDQWTVKRLTLNVGVRFEALNGHVPAQHVPAVQFVAERNFPAVDDSPAFKDVSPRLGVSYDLFGNGRTAIKFSLGRFVEGTGIRLTSANNPISTSVTEVNRTWNDANRNYIPDCDLGNFSTNGECGPISDLNFGQNNPRATRYADDVLRGFGVRNFGWDLLTEVEHELLPGISVTGGYYRNWANNFRVVDNLVVGPMDFDPYCIVAPLDPRLPGGGGYQVCGLYDITPARFGQVDNVVTQASHYYGPDDGVTCSTAGTAATYAFSLGRAGGNHCSKSDFFGVNVNTRFGRDIQLGGGVDTGRTVIDSCFVVDSPQQRLNCHAVLPFRAQTQVKIFGSVPLPGDVTISGTLQNQPGGPYEANYSARNVEIASSLGRDLAACGARTGAACTATATVPLIAPMTQFLDRRTQLDLRLSKGLRLGPTVRLRVNLDLYNALNSNTVLAVSNTYGPRWLNPTGQQTNRDVDSIMPGRLIHLGARLTF